MDKDFLTSLGYVIVESPFAWDKVTKESLVYGIHCYNDVMRSVIEDVRPAMMIRNILHSELWYVNYVDQSAWAKIIRNPETHGSQAYHAQLRGEYHEDDFPQPQNGNAFSDTKIYWRNTTKPAVPTITTSPTKHITFSNEERVTADTVQHAITPASLTQDIKVSTQENTEELVDSGISPTAPTPTLQETVSATKHEIDSIAVENENVGDQPRLEDDTAPVAPSSSKDIPVKVVKPESSTVIVPSAAEESNSEGTFKLSQEDTSAATPTLSTESYIADRNLDETNSPTVTITESSSSSSRRKTQREFSVIIGTATQDVGMSATDGRIPGCRSVSPTSVGCESSKAASRYDAQISPMRSSSYQTINKPLTMQTRVVQRSNSPVSSESTSPNTSLRHQQREFIEAKAIEMKARIKAEEATFREIARKQADTFSAWLQRKGSTSPSNIDKKKRIILENIVSQQVSQPSVNSDFAKDNFEKHSLPADDKETIVKIEGSCQRADNSSRTHVVESELAKGTSVSNAVVNDSILREANDLDAPIVNCNIIKNEVHIAVTVEEANSYSPVVKATLMKEAHEMPTPAPASETVKMESDIFNDTARNIKANNPKTTAVIPEFEADDAIVDENIVGSSNAPYEQPTIDLEALLTPEMPEAFPELEKITIPENTTANSTDTFIDVDDAQALRMFEVFTELKKIIAVDETVAGPEDATNSNEEQLGCCKLDDHSPKSTIVAKELVDKHSVPERSTANDYSGSEAVTDGLSSRVSNVKSIKVAKAANAAATKISNACGGHLDTSLGEIEAAAKIVERSTADSPDTSNIKSSKAREGGGKKIELGKAEPYKVTIQAARTESLKFKSIKFSGPITMKNFCVGSINFGEVNMPNGLFIEFDED